MGINDTDEPTFENMSMIGFEYMYFDGFHCRHKSGIVIYTDGSPKKVFFKGGTQVCNTIKEVKELIEKVEKNNK